jgi:HAD superfamily hydrolase (TIGR01509 family)
MRLPIVFLDDAGVLNDYTAWPEQWERLVGEFFAPRLGGTRAAWAEANRVVMDWIYQDDVRNGLIEGAPDYRAFERAFDLAWLGRMCERVGVVVPVEQECLGLARQAEAYVSRRIHSALPGAAEAVRKLHALCYTLHTASGHNSIVLDGHLTAMGVRDCFGGLYGPDLANAFKESPAFYERAFADAGIAPGDALVADDSPRAVGWAVAAGARAVLVGQDVGVTADHDRRVERIGSLADLPTLLGKLG